MLRILHTNDFHGTLTGATLKAMEELRPWADVYFDTGDGIKTGNLGIPLAQEPYWAALTQLRCTASTLGNRESHPQAFAFERKLAGRSHPVVVSNLIDKQGNRPFPSYLEFEAGRVKVGVIGTMVAMVTAKMKTQALSSFLWEQPIPRVKEVAEELRTKVDVLIVLSHIGISQDRKLAEAVPEIDLILGGHSHTVLEQPERVGNVFICQGGSHGRFAGQYEWDGRLLGAELVKLPER